MIDLNNVDRPTILAEMAAAFYQYEEALVSNNIEALDALFWHDPCIVWLGAGENLYGIEAIRTFRAARPAAGLARDLRHATITTFGVDMAVCNTEFTHEGSARLDHQQQTRVCSPYGWCIVAAQVSLMDRVAYTGTDRKIRYPPARFRFGNTLFGVEDHGVRQSS